MTTVAEEDVLTAVELDLTVDPIAAVVEAATPAATPDPEAIEHPFIRVIKGAPSDEDVAALVLVLSAAANGAAGSGPAGPADGWGRPTLMHRGTSPFSPYAFPQLSHLRD
ncbi:acyl-CoA carboxylase subunit epsilon [Nocardia sp. NBC_00565]|uniref:acyl-CoA carboxylase subunit epsilon n=1 Tax=Nocardia sp. NBC_00565 TaxID=2975993 RepID=UPI002E808DB5|nr:acyl-CoA carboxylase subunit epsilon [Nocardia sp. NBC_00565]WUC03068.1 acyl-CoA carboxylase subunit epsilon [Nocardia sp. NBC_00565]